MIFFLRSCCENAWLCADVSVYTATQMNPYERTSHHFFFSLLSLFPPLCLFFSLLTAGPELGRCIWVAARQGGVPLLISQVCSVLISALVSSPYSVSSVWLTSIPTRYQKSSFILKMQKNDCNVVLFLSYMLFHLSAKPNTPLLSFLFHLFPL